MTLATPAVFTSNTDLKAPCLFVDVTMQGLLSGYYQMMVNDLFGVPLILDTDLNPVGIATHSCMSWDESSAAWKGTTLKDSGRLPLDEYWSFIESVENQYSPLLYKVKIELRQETDTEDEGGMWSSLYSSMFGSSGGTIEPLERYGLAIDSRTILIPTFITREKTAKIENVTVSIDESTDAGGTFSGVFEEFGAVIIKVDDDVELQNASERMVFQDIQPYTAYFSLHAEEKFGQQYVFCSHFRCFDQQKIFENKYRWNLFGEILPGDFVLNDDGDIVALYIKRRKKGQEIHDYLKSGRTRYTDYSSRKMWYPGSADHDLLALGVLEEQLEKPELHLDPRIKPLTKEQEKRKVWLGIEYSRITEDLAENLKVEKPTKDGEIGIQVSQVYPGSPAERIGIESGDILLALEVPDLRYPIELRPPMDEFQEFDYGRYDIPEQFEAFGLEMPKKKPWRTRSNFVTGLLDVIGVGTTIEVVYYSEGEEQKAAVTLEYAPPDYASAEKFKDDEIGLTIKNLTYEVRRALKITGNESGVVVAKVKSGTYASVAGIKQYEIISSIGNEPVDDVDDFEATITDAQKAGKEKVSLRVLSMGKSRVVDLKIPEQETDEVE